MIIDGLQQTVTYWSTPASDGSGGFTYAAPTALAARWEERQEEFTSPQGETKISKAMVFTSVDIEVGGYLFLGTSVEADPTGVSGAFLISQVIKTPDVRGENFERRALL